MVVVLLVCTLDRTYEYTGLFLTGYKCHCSAVTKVFISYNKNLGSRVT